MGLGLGSRAWAALVWAEQQGACDLDEAGRVFFPRAGAGEVVFFSLGFMSLKHLGLDHFCGRCKVWAFCLSHPLSK